MLWINFPSKQAIPTQQLTPSGISKSSDSKYVKKTIINPFKRSHADEVESDDILPTITALQAEFPQFSSLHLRLHGIVYQDKQKGYAMVSMHSAIQEIYRVTDRISEGLYLVAIAKKQVEVDYFGERHILLVDNTRTFESRYSLETNDAQNLELSFDQQIEYLETDKKRNPIRLFMIRRPYAIYSSANFLGYKIMPGSNEDQFKRLGFKSGDIITY